MAPQFTFLLNQFDFNLALSCFACIIGRTQASNATPNNNDTWKTLRSSTHCFQSHKRVIFFFGVSLALNQFPAFERFRKLTSQLREKNAIEIERATLCVLPRRCVHSRL